MQRTSCACEACQIGCKTLPGALAPADVIPMWQHVDPESGLFQFSEKYLQVSSGAIAVDPASGTRFNVPSLVPKQREDGTCVFYNQQGRCDIHAVSPYGCSMVDMHQSGSEANDIVRQCVLQQYDAHRSGSIYHQLCVYLDSVGQRARPLVERRQAYENMIEAFEEKQNVKQPD